MGGLSRGRDPEKLVSEAGQNKDQFVFSWNYVFNQTEQRNTCKTRSNVTSRITWRHKFKDNRMSEKNVHVWQWADKGNRLKCSLGLLDHQAPLASKWVYGILRLLEVSRDCLVKTWEGMKSMPGKRKINIKVHKYQKHLADKMSS